MLLGIPDEFRRKMMMSKHNGVIAKHTKQQLNNYSNQNNLTMLHIEPINNHSNQYNPNNKNYQGHKK